MNPELQKKMFLLAERMWLVGIAIGVIGAIIFLIMRDNDSALYFFGFFILSAVLYMLRKSQRKKHEAYLESKKNAK